MKLQVQGKASIASYKLFNYFVKKKQEGQSLEIQQTIATSQSIAIDSTINQPVAIGLGKKEEFLKDLEG